MSWSEAKWIHAIHMLWEHSTSRATKAIHYLTCLQASGLGEACMLTVQESLYAWFAGLVAHSYFLI